MLSVLFFLDTMYRPIYNSNSTVKTEDTEALGKQDQGPIQSTDL